jgi:hypothetical protein
VRRSTAEARVKTLERDLAATGAALAQTRESEGALQAAQAAAEVSRANLQLALKETKDELADAHLTLDVRVLMH